jgi:hypothetical protein
MRYFRLAFVEGESQQKGRVKFAIDGELLDVFEELPIGLLIDQYAFPSWNQLQRAAQTRKELALNGSSAAESAVSDPERPHVKE